MSIIQYSSQCHVGFSFYNVKNEETLSIKVCIFDLLETFFINTDPTDCSMY